VLPFANLSGDPAQAFFSDGIAEELRNALSQIRGLKVIGRVSSEQFRDAKDLSAAAEKLGVDHILTGSVRRSPTTIRIGAQLVDGKTGIESWSQSYDQPVGDALAVQSKIASNVLAALSQRLGQSVGSVAVGGTTNAAAQELFLKAQALRNTGGNEGVGRQMLALVDSAIALDPRYAEAHAMRGNILADFASNGYGTGAARLGYQQEDAMAAAQRAVALAPTSGLARMGLAARYQDVLDVRSAIAEGEAALRLAAGDARVLNQFGTIVRGFDPDRAVELTQRALTLDPFNVRIARNQTRNLVYARRYADAVAAGRKTVTMSENRSDAAFRAGALIRLGRYDEARKLLPDVEIDWYRFTLAAMLEARAGNRAASDAALAAMRRIDDGLMHYQFAQIHAERGETALALDEIEAALRGKDPGLADIAVDAAFDSIRQEPRFKAVQDKIIPPDLFVPPRG
jgi:serine/threonine-protein kinase